nr:unnamed protein product [Callosobruchus chinensis]
MEVGDAIHLLQTYFQLGMSEGDQEAMQKILEKNFQNIFKLISEWHSRARRVIENVFGILCQKFRIYYRKICISPEYVDNVIVATCALHNFLIDDTVSLEDDDSDEIQLQNLPHVRGNFVNEAIQIRNTFKEYFTSPHVNKKKKRRRYWIHPLNTRRIYESPYYLKRAKLRAHPDKFFDFYRMSTNSFDELHNGIRDKLIKQNTCMRLSLDTEEKLTITLRFLATGKNFEELHFEYLMGSRTVSAVVKETCTAIWEVFQPLEMKPPSSKERWLEIAENYYKRTNFPNCVGSVDGKHIRLISPLHSGSAFYNYKKFYSVVLLAVVDSEYRFIAVDVGAYGRDSDSNIFNNWNFGKKLTQNRLNMPETKPLPNTNDTPLPFVFLGDEARDGYRFEDTLTHYFEDIPFRSPQHRSTNRGRNIRDNFAGYFMTPAGEISYQYNERISTNLIRGDIDAGMLELVLTDTASNYQMGFANLVATFARHSRRHAYCSEEASNESDKRGRLVLIILEEDDNELMRSLKFSRSVSKGYISVFEHNSDNNELNLDIRVKTANMAISFAMYLLSFIKSSVRGSTSAQFILFAIIVLRALEDILQVHSRSMLLMNILAIDDFFKVLYILHNLQLIPLFDYISNMISQIRVTSKIDKETGTSNT